MTLAQDADAIRAALAPLTARGWGVAIDPMAEWPGVLVLVLDGTPMQKWGRGPDTLSALADARRVMELPT